MNPHVDAVLDDCAKRFYAGDRLQLMQAVIWCGRYKIAPPPWVLAEFERAMQLYQDGEAKDIAEAFDIKRPPHERLPTIRAKRRRDANAVELIVRVYLAVEELSKSEPISRSLFETVAEKFPGLSAGTIANYYYEVKANREKAPDF